MAHSYFQRLRASSPPSPSKPAVQIYETGGAIMNSVTVHRLRSRQKRRDDEIVCVMSRIPTSESSANGENEGTGQTWQRMADLRLSPAPLNDACFSTAFSPSGHVCAVAQQSGVVTLFDTTMIHEDMEDDDAMIEVLKSSRASVQRDYAGAVRSMSFSPPPWDLLAWAEDRGRICVIDLRTSCRSRQIIDLELDSPRINRASVTDLDDGQTTSEQRQLEIERRFLQRQREALNAQNDLAGVRHVADYIELSAARRRLQRDAGPIYGEFNDLTESERQMLDALRTHNPQADHHTAPEHDTQRPYSVSYLHDQDTEPLEAQINAYVRPPSSSSGERFSAQLARLSRMRDTVRGNYANRSRTSDRGTYQPRRRSSMVISSSNNISEHASSSHPSSLAPIGSSIPTMSASPSRLASVVASAENADDHDHSPSSEYADAWRTVADAMGNAAVDPSSEPEGDQLRRQHREDSSRDSGSTATMLRLLQQQQQQTVRLDRIRSQRNTNSRQLQALNRAMAGERGHDPAELDVLRRLTETTARSEHGVTTMGIGWNSDGRNLYVATEEGVLELTINLDERKQFPSMALH
ncbi:MAG: hypothetical protein L6R39_003773 [Caloplaca ligustica]|nr:MAG: hypothetical protein L6R39_003773 [Caloplaca ligustica]